MKDPTLTELSYQTDNGAEYCFCSTNCTAPLLAMKKYLKAEEVPVKLMSFQVCTASTHWCLVVWRVCICVIEHCIYRREVGGKTRIFTRPARLLGVFPSGVRTRQNSPKEWLPSHATSVCPCSCTALTFVPTRPTPLGSTWSPRTPRCPAVEARPITISATPHQTEATLSIPGCSSKAKPWAWYPLNQTFWNRTSSACPRT